MQKRLLPLAERGLLPAPQSQEQNSHVHDTWLSTLRVQHSLHLGTPHGIYGSRSVLLSWVACNGNGHAHRSSARLERGTRSTAIHLLRSAVKSSLQADLKIHVLSAGWPQNA